LVTLTSDYTRGATYRRFLSLDPIWATTGAASDLAFRTFVEPAAAPEPATLILMGLGLAGVGYRRYKVA